MALGIDIGGTTIKGGLISSKGEILLEKKIKTRAKEGMEKVVARICLLAKEIAVEGKKELKDLAGIGVGIPGFVEYDQGTVLLAPNLQWKDIPLRQMLTERLKLPIYLDNDVNAAALGELKFGVGQGVEDFIMLTVGTGLGGALVLKGEIYRGNLGLAGEVGHMVIQEQGPRCGCGQKGCIETFTSATSLVRKARAVKLEVNEAKEIFQLAHQGNKKAVELIEEMAFYLALGISNLNNLLNPQLIIIGGGVSKAGDILFNPLRKNVDKMALTSLSKKLKIEPAKLGNKAGMLGASSMVFYRKNRLIFPNL